MFFAQRNIVAGLIAVLCGSSVCRLSAAESPDPPATKPPRIGSIAPAAQPVTADLRESPGCIDIAGPLNFPDQPLVQGKELSLTYVVAQTWFSTEAMVLPASNFVFSGKTSDNAFYKSAPVVSGTPPQLRDSFYTYERNFDLVPYYSASSSTPAAPGSTAPQTHSCGEPTPNPPDPSMEEPLLQSKVPLSYRHLKPNSFESGAMVVLRPFIQPNASSVSFSDQVGINGTPRWSLLLTANPVLHPFFDKQKTQTGALNYLSLNVNVDLNNQVNANPNSSIAAIEWNRRSHQPLQSGMFFNDNPARRGQWLRKPELDVSLTGAEYDFVSNDVNLYYPSPSVKFPLAVLDKSGVPAVFVWKLQLGELAGYHIRNPSANLAGNRSVHAAIATEGSQLFRGVAGTTMNVQGWGGAGWMAWLSGFSINSTYQVMLPTTDEPFTIASASSSKPPTVTLTDKARNYVKSSIAERLGNSNFSLGLTYQYGSLPPAFWLVKNSLMVSITLSSGSSRAE
jgi:hypothetical protein